ncbi:MAG: hypothetical protein ACRC33_02635 [Gemmataceae bacterium]
MRTLSRFLLVASLVGLAGCGDGGPKLGQVEGTVRLNGKPVAGLRVDYNPDVERSGQASPGLSSHAHTGEDGRYSLTYDDRSRPRPGAVVGKHVVVVSDPEAEDQTRKVQTSRIPLMYSRVTETPLRHEVKSGAQTIDIDLR